LVNSDEDIRYVQFVDGDCELIPNWLDTARERLDATSQAAVVCGALIERSPETSIYNRLCALEWKSLPGETQACGGIFMIRREVFESVGGFNESLIAGEEAELCYRLRASNWSVLRLNEQMASHDAAITRFGQWCRRAIRSGHAYAERAWLHHKSPERPWRRQLRGDWFWGFFLPFAAIAAAWPSLGISLVTLLFYPIWVWKIFSERRRRLGDSPADARLYALFCMLAKFPSFVGQVLFWWRRFTGRQASLIEYKSAE
jgi:GT2 family glycosyltransferase